MKFKQAKAIFFIFILIFTLASFYGCTDDSENNLLDAPDYNGGSWNNSKIQIDINVGQAFYLKVMSADQEGDGTGVGTYTLKWELIL